MEGSLAGDPVTGITAGTAQGHCIAGDRLVFKAVCGQQFKRLGVLAGQSQVYIFHGQRFGDCDAVKAAEINQLYQIFVPADAVEEMSTQPGASVVKGCLIGRTLSRRSQKISL